MAYIGQAPSTIVSENTFDEFNFTATSNQTTFTGVDSDGKTLVYNPGNLEVFLNGVRLEEADFTATNGTSVVLATGATTGDVMSVKSFTVFEVSDTVSKASGGAFGGNISVTGTVTATSYSGDGSSLSGISTDVVGDITPQLGGNLDLNSKNITGTGDIDITGDININRTSGTTVFKTSVAANSTVGFEINKTGSTTQSWRIVDGETVNGALQFYDVTDSRVSMQIDGSGTVLVGRTADGDSTEGAMIRGTGFIQSTRDGSLAADFNRLSSDGDIIRFQKASSPVGTIGYESSGLYVDGEANHAGLKLFASSVAPRQNGADVDATIDLGWTGGKFKDIYASGTVYATPGGNDGSSANYAANSANEILNNYGYKPSGLYWIREPNTGTPKQIYCDMETDGGGWMLWLEYNTSTNSMHNQATARGNLARSYNNNYSKYEVMIDSSWVGQVNRRSIRGVWELDANGGIRTNGFRNWGEVRLPETVGDQFQPDLDTYFNSGSNSEWIGRTEYYAIAGASGWSSIGSGSSYVYIREPNPAVKPGTMRSYGGINYVWDYDGTQYGWWVHESSYAVPMFNTVTQNGGFEVGYAGGRRDVMEPNSSTGKNSYVNVSNGNNGPAILGVGSGVLVGEFSIMFNLGYSWGWSEMYIQDAIRTDNNMKNGGSPGSSLGDVFYYANNSSNNQGYYVYKTSDGVTQATAGGLTPYSFGNYYTMTRRRDGNLYVRDPGANIYNPGAFFGPMKFFTGAQSPHSTQILNVISAGRNSALTASNEQAQTTLRH